MTPHPLEFHGITPPPQGSKRTMCPTCRHESQERGAARSLVIRKEFGGWQAYCHNCHWEEWVPE